MKRYLITFSIAILACVSVPAQKLHNGIVLPSEWPPKYEVPSTRQEMPIPYLKDKPEVIGVNVGRQLFVDDFLVSETTLERKFHTPKYYEGNPVLEPDKEWEKTEGGLPYAAPFSDGIWYDEQTGKFRMWYMAGANGIRKGDNQAFYTCYAESDDGKYWVKPVLDVYNNTNVVDTCVRDASTMWLDKRESDPAKRFKLFNIEKRATDKRWQFILKYSADGIHWSKGVAQSGDVYDRSTVFYNPFTDKWVMSLRFGTPISGRSRAYLENEDPEMAVSLVHRIKPGVEDKNVRFWFTPDDKELRHPRFPDVEPGIYNFDAMPYESIIIGYYSAWCGPENNVCKEEGIQKRNVVSLGYSRDGFHFSRPTHQAFMNVNETDGAWNWGNMQSIGGQPLIVGDSLYFYASGRRLNDIMWDCYTSTGLATLRRDGFVSMSAADKEGHLTTEKLSFDGKYLFVNANVGSRKGRLYVEVLDEDGRPVSGFTKKECQVMKSTDSTKYRITWKDKSDLSELAGKNIRLRFYLTGGDLYAFWISPWQSGESRGYTAGGGPNLNASGIDNPL